MKAYGGVHGAGIGSGNASDECNVSISGGNVLAVGGKSSESEMEGAAGIGSGSYYSSNKPAYRQLTNVSVSITGGTVTAIGGWGAAGIGSGASNEMADSISITGGDVQAYSDGTKFAVDTRLLEGETTTSRTKGRTVGTPLIQGTFVHAYTTEEGLVQNPEGLGTIDLVRDSDGETARTLTRMPEGYRSFAATVPAAGIYNIYTDADSIGEGAGRYFAAARQDVYHADELEDVIGFPVTGSALSDNFYLYPVKSFVVIKKIQAEEGTDLSGLNTVIHVALKLGKSETVLGTGEIVIEEGKAKNRVVFVNVPDNRYELWETDAEGNRAEAGTRTGDYVLRKIETEDSGAGGSNNGRIDANQWTDTVVLVNTYGRNPSGEHYRTPAGGRGSRGGADGAGGRGREVELRLHGPVRIRGRGEDHLHGDRGPGGGIYRRL